MTAPTTTPGDVSTRRPWRAIALDILGLALIIAGALAIIGAAWATSPVIGTAVTGAAAVTTGITITYRAT